MGLGRGKGRKQRRRKETESEVAIRWAKEEERARRTLQMEWMTASVIGCRTVTSTPNKCFKALGIKKHFPFNKLQRQRLALQAT